MVMSETPKIPLCFQLFSRGDYVAIAASGGKDSTVLAHVMKLLNDRYDYGLKLVLLSIDEGITGYRYEFASRQVPLKLERGEKFLSR